MRTSSASINTSLNQVRYKIIYSLQTLDMAKKTLLMTLLVNTSSQGGIVRIIRKTIDSKHEQPIAV